jgi:hypothetical protein
VSATDSNNLAGTRSFVVGVAAGANTGPTLNALNDLVINEDAGLQTIGLAGISSGASNETQVLSVTAVSSNPALITNLLVTYTSPNSTGTLAFSPLPNANGVAIISVTVNDGGSQNTTFTRSFTVTVNALNDPPTLDAIDDVVINEDIAGTVILNGISAGPNESQSIIVTAISSDQALIPNPSILYVSPNTSGLLSFAPAPNANGTAIITVTVNDGQGQNNLFSRSFTVTVNAVNDPPTLDQVADLTIDQNSGVQTISLTGIGSGAPNESQSLTISAISSLPALIPNPTVNYSSPSASGILTFTPIAGATGTVVIAVTVLDDGGTARRGQNSSVRSFKVVIRPGNTNSAPRLRIDAAGQNVVLSWPADAVGYGLRSKSEMAGSGWAPVTDIPFILAGRCYVTNTPFGSSRFYQLMKTTTTAPQLTISAVNKNVVISWPAVSTGFVLESSSELGPTANWTAVDGHSIVAGNLQSVTITNLETVRFFRLRSP